MQLHVGDEVFGYLSIRADGERKLRLTKAEHDVASSVYDGCSNEEIARRRNTSVHTVGNQLAAIYRKTGVSNRHELVVWLSQSVEPTK